MNPAYSSTPRQTETLRCCGVLYRRWRFVGCKFNRTHAKHCSHCGARLYWQPNHTPINRRRVDRERQLIRRINFSLAGRRSDGLPLARVPLTADQRAQRKRDMYHRRAQQRAAAGLTSRGTMPAYRPRVHARERAWRDLRAAMNITRPDFLSHLEQGEEAA
jgi:hypothetical protein